jgi:hypothetical protein
VVAAEEKLLSDQSGTRSDDPIIQPNSNYAPEFSKVSEIAALAISKEFGDQHD